VVVEVEVGDVRLPLHRSLIHREAVVLGGDLHLPGQEVLDRLVRPSMAELHLVGRPADGPGEDLVTEADAEHRHLAQQRRHRAVGARHRRRVPGAVGQEHAVRPLRQHLLHRVAAGTTVTRQPASTRSWIIAFFKP
jgi:hypothetical protein